MAIIMKNTAPSQLFTYNSKKKMFVGEASDMRGCLGRIWDDAADYGFIMKSAMSGKEVIFTHNRDIEDAEGELQVEVFRAEIGGEWFEAHILND